MMKQFEHLRGMISATPLLEIHLNYRGKPRTVFAKAEYYNLTGSIKDRVAYYILKKAYETGEIQPGDRIVEATSGNTGIAFCALGTYLKHPVTIYMPDWMSRERINLMKSFGAQVRLVSKEEGGFLGSIAMTEALAKEGGVFLPRQFSNEENVNAHIEDTGAELLAQFKRMERQPDGIVAGVGTGGTIMGLARALRAEYPHVKACPLEPANSPTLSTGCKTGKHRIQGISDEFIPSILHLDELDEIISVDDVDAIRMAQKLSRVLGLGVGISSGANLLGAVLLGEALGNEGAVVTVFADDNKKYLSTDYTVEWQAGEGHLSDKIELLDYKAWR